MSHRYRLMSTIIRRRRRMRSRTPYLIGRSGASAGGVEVAHPNKKTAGSTDGPFVDMSLGLMRSTLPLAF